MKRVCKTDEPQSLTAFKADNPNGTWDDMRANDRQAARDCLEQAISDQKGLCAYCEKKISPQEPLHCRVEHFHPKSDSREWHLDWQNMLATCDGGEADKATDPLPENLSCDAYKNHLVNKGYLRPDALERSLLNPLDLPLFPNIFDFDQSSGQFSINSAACRQASVNICKLQYTINVLNLNCTRLLKMRRKVFLAIENRKKELRCRQYDHQTIINIMLKQYLGCEKRPEYFTTYRCCLGQAAEKYLQSTNYNG